MSFVIYNKETTIILRKHWYDQPYATEAAAKAALTRFIKAGWEVKREDFAIADTKTFCASIEKKEIRHGIVHAEGKEFSVGVNTPWTTGPWSETYWSS